jgi:hypothetical protein
LVLATCRCAAPRRPWRVQLCSDAGPHTI